MANKSKDPALMFDIDAVLGISVFSEDAAKKLNEVRHARLSSKSTYVILPQYVHDEKIKEYKGFDKSKKLFILEVRNGEVLQVMSLSVSQLRARYLLNRETEEAPKLLAAQEHVEGTNVSVWRVKKGVKVNDEEVTNHSVIVAGYLPLKGEEERHDGGEGSFGYIDRPCQFTVSERTHEVWKPVIKAHDASKKYYDYARNGQNVALEASFVYDYSFELLSPNHEYGVLSDYLTKMPNASQFDYVR